jgi:hypothetical protein
MRMRHSRVDANTATGQFVVERNRYGDGDGWVTALGAAGTSGVRARSGHPTRPVTVLWRSGDEDRRH